MATIYRAHDASSSRDVAVKVLRPEYGRDPDFVARFRQEAQSAASLNHPNVVDVFDYGMDAAGPFIVMELVDGGDLAAIIRASGAAAAAPGRAHRRRSPGRSTPRTRAASSTATSSPATSCSTSDGRVKVADFGIARAFSEAQLTMPGTTLG